MVWIWIAVLLILLCFITCIAQIRIKLDYQYRQHDGQFRAKLFLWKLSIYTIEIPLLQFDPDSSSVIVEENSNVANHKKHVKKKLTVQTILNNMRKMNEWIKHIGQLHKIVRRFLRKVRINQLSWHSELGIGDASHTGEAAGMVWMMKGLIIGTAANYMSLAAHPNLSVTPHFQQMLLQTHFTCMISFRVGHAILAGLLIVKHWKKRPTFSQVEQTNEKQM